MLVLQGRAVADRVSTEVTAPVNTRSCATVRTDSKDPSVSSVSIQAQPYNPYNTAPLLRPCLTNARPISNTTDVHGSNWQCGGGLGHDLLNSREMTSCRGYILLVWRVYVITSEEHAEALFFPSKCHHAITGLRVAPRDDQTFGLSAKRHSISKTHSTP